MPFNTLKYDMFQKTGDKTRLILTDSYSTYFFGRIILRKISFSNKFFYLYLRNLKQKFFSITAPLLTLFVWNIAQY